MRSIKSVVEMQIVVTVAVAAVSFVCQSAALCPSECSCLSAGILCVGAMFTEFPIFNASLKNTTRTLYDTKILAMLA